MNYSLLGALAVALGQPVFAAEMPAMPMQGMQMAQPAAAASARASGTIKAIDMQKNRVTIAHGPVPALKWPAMTMGFKAAPAQLARLQPGDQVTFEFESAGMQATLLSIEAVK